MSGLNDKIYGREVVTRPRKTMITGRGGAGNARKSIPSAGGESNTSVGTMSILSSQTRTASGSDKSSRTRRWSSASEDFSAIISVSRDLSEPDRDDLYTISSRSTNTTDSAALSDIPSFISEFTFQTSSNPSHRSRPPAMASNPSRRSGQSDWLTRIPRSYSHDSLPQAIPEAVEAAPIKANPAAPVSFFDPFMVGYIPTTKTTDYPRRASEIAPFDEPIDPVVATPRKEPRSKSPRRFRMFRKSSAPRVEPIDTRPPNAYMLNFSSSLGQSTETVNLHSTSLPSEGSNSPIVDARRRNSSTFATTAKQVLRIGTSDP